jgi:hypothetical protein
MAKALLSPESEVARCREGMWSIFFRVDTSAAVSLFVVVPVAQAPQSYICALTLSDRHREIQR